MQLQQIMEQKKEFAFITLFLACYELSVDLNECVPKVIVRVPSKYWRCSSVRALTSLCDWIFACKHEASLMLQRLANPSFASNVIILVYMQALAKFRLSWWLFLVDNLAWSQKSIVSGFKALTQFVWTIIKQILHFTVDWNTNKPWKCWISGLLLPS